MNKHNAKDYLPLVQALAEGRQLQARNFNGGWTDVDECSFGGDLSDYRIKPEPRKAWVWWPPTGIDASAVAFWSEAHARNMITQHGGHITEVTE